MINNKDPFDLDGEPVAPDRVLTSHEVARVLQVNPSSVNTWVRKNMIKALRTPGGHRRIRASDLVDFIQEFELMHVPPVLSLAAYKRVLWIDSDKSARNAMVKKFAVDAVTFVTAASALEGMITAGQMSPHIVVIDGRADDVDRIEVVSVLRSHERTKDARIVFVDGETTDEERKAGEKLGVSLFLERGKSPLSVLDEVAQGGAL